MTALVCTQTPRHSVIFMMNELLIATSILCSTKYFITQQQLSHICIPSFCRLFMKILPFVAHTNTTISLIILTICYYFEEWKHTQNAVSRIAAENIFLFTLCTFCHNFTLTRCVACGERAGSQTSFWMANASTAFSFVTAHLKVSFLRFSWRVNSFSYHVFILTPLTSFICYVFVFFVLYLHKFWFLFIFCGFYFACIVKKKTTLFFQYRTRCVYNIVLIFIHFAGYPAQDYAEKFAFADHY